jgi:hypothetical protein
MNEENKLSIEEDKAKHPNCHYSESLSKSLSYTDGKSVSETLRNVQRLCPGKKPVTIFSKKITDGNDDSDDFSMPTFGFSGGFGGMFGQSKDFGFGSLGQGEVTRNRNHPPAHSNGVLPPQAATDQQLEEMFGNNGNRFRGKIAGPSEDI